MLRPQNVADTRRRRKHDAIYGVFWEEEDDDDDEQSLRRKKSTIRRGTKRPDMSCRDAAVPQFIKATTTATDSTTFVNRKQQQQQEEEEETRKRPDAFDLQHQKEHQEANEYFLSLLEKGRGTKRPRKSREPSPIEQQQDSMILEQQHTGLGFQTGLAFEQSSQPSTDAEQFLPQGGLGYQRTRQITGLGFQSATTQQTGLGFQQSTAQESDRDFQAAAQSGFRPATKSASIPVAFGRKAAAAPPSSSNIPKHSNIGQWEKHTKGIGMKLLSKMGYKGTGGLKAQSIAAPLPVKVRPANLGLGFGNFKEATSVQPKQQSKLLKEQRDDRTARASVISSSSALPSSNEIMQQQSWKRRRRNNNDAKANFVPYSELLLKQKDQPVKIIDMRGPTVTTTATMSNQEIPLAEELLHNVSMLLTTYETRIHSSDQFAETHRRQSTSLRNDLTRLEQQMDVESSRQAKLALVMPILDSVERTLQSSASFQEKMKETRFLIRQLGDSFTEAERTKLRFSIILFPALLGTVVDAELQMWDPLLSSSQDSTTTNPRVEEIIRSILSVDDNSNDDRSVPKAMLVNHLLPKLKRTLESSRWDPVNDDDQAALYVYELLIRAVQQVEAKLNARMDENDLEEEEHGVFLSDKQRQRTELSDLVRETLVHDTIYNKLSRAIASWKPRLEIIVSIRGFYRGCRT